MFDKKTIDAYRSISAPDELKQKVLASCTSDIPRQRSFMGNIRIFATLAACFVLVIMLSVFAVGDFGDLSVSVRGMTLSSEPVNLITQRSAIVAYGMDSYAKTSVPVEVAVNSNTELTVTGGMMRACKMDTEEEYDSGTKLLIDSDTLIYWDVESSAAESHFEMTVTGQKKSYRIILDYDQYKKTWSIYQEKMQ